MLIHSKVLFTITYREKIILFYDLHNIDKMKYSIQKSIYIIHLM